MPMRPTTNYRELWRRKGIMRIPARPYRFDFENNEDEERAIAEAIAREEERMRQEEFNKGWLPEPGARDPAGRPYDEDPEEHARMLPVSRLGVGLSPQPTFTRYISNLTILRDDSSNMRAVKQVLEAIVTQVCRWDKQFGWYKMALAKSSKLNFERHRAFANSKEAILANHMDRLKKEINKRRTRLENKAEELCGLPTPWRKLRMKSYLKADNDWQEFGYLLEESDKGCAEQKISDGSRSALKSAESRRPAPVVINPAEISLGGDVVVWEKETETVEVKKDEGGKELVHVEECKPAFRNQPEVVKVVEEPETVTDWHPPKQTASLPTTPTNRNTVSERSFEETSSSGSETKRRGRPPKRRHHGLERRRKDKEPLELDPNKLHCVCQSAYDPKRFYVACDMCYRWFHGDCVGISEEDVKEITEWTCEDCLEERKKARQEQELYCTCRTPYSDTEFYVGCEGCEGWFHPRCVGITKEEAESMAEYLCPTCVEAQTSQGYESTGSAASSIHATLCRADYPLVWRLLEKVSEHRMSWPFRQPVSSKEFPNYLSVVENPIDLSIIQRRLENLEYQRLKDFTRDMTRLFQNARTFFPQESNVYQCADTLEKIFEHALAEVKAEIDERINGRRVSETRTVDSSLDIDTDQLIDVNLDVDPTMFLL